MVPPCPVIPSRPDINDKVIRIVYLSLWGPNDIIDDSRLKISQDGPGVILISFYLIEVDTDVLPLIIIGADVVALIV